MGRIQRRAWGRAVAASPRTRPAAIHRVVLFDPSAPGLDLSETLKSSKSSISIMCKFLVEKGLLKVLEYKPHQVEKLIKEGGGPIKDTVKMMKAKRWRCVQS